MFYGITASCVIGLAWVVCGIILGEAGRKKLNTDILILFYSLIAMLFSIGVGVFTGLGGASFAALAWVFGVLFVSGLFNVFQLIFLAYALKRGPNGVVWSITQSAFAFPFLMGILFFGVTANPTRWCGFFAIISGLVFMGYKKKAAQPEGANWQWLALGAFVATGMGQTFANLPSYFSGADAINGFWRTAFVFCGMAVGSLVPFLANRQGRITFVSECKKGAGKWRIWQYALLMVVAEVIPSQFLLYSGMNALVKAGAGAIAFPIMVGTCMVGFEGFSIGVLREKRSILQWVALVLCLGGVIAITL